MIKTLASLLLGYLIGAVPTGVVVARAWGQVDLTQVGSRRTGATNVLRTIGKKAAALVFAGDFLKGVVAVGLGGLLAPAAGWGAALGGIAAVAGHCYSPFIGFKGGRGVTTGLGALLALSPVAGFCGLLAGVIAIGATRYVSLGSVLGATLGSLVVIVRALQNRSASSPARIAFGLVVGPFIVAVHHDNLDRLRRGTERRLGQRVEESG